MPAAGLSEAADGRAAFGFRFVAPLALGAILNPINSTMIATALVPIAADFHASAAAVGWLIAGLYMACAIAQPTMGRLADLFGARRILLVALAMVAAAGLLGPLAPSLGSLVAVRVLLGVGTSAAYPASMRIFRTQADRLGCEPPRAAMGYLSLAAQSTTALGYLAGGLLTGAFGWHSIFTVNLPLALIAALLVVLWIPADPRRTRAAGGLARELDLIGITLFAGMLISAMTFLMNLDRPIWWGMLGAVAFGAALTVHSARRSNPFVDVRMLAHNRALTMTYLRAGATALICYCVIYALGQWLESSAGFSSSAAGLVLLPVALVGAIASQAGARAKGIRVPFILTAAAALVGCVCLLLIDSATPAWQIAAATMLFGLPLGLFSTATQAAVYIQAPPAAIGAAAGLQRTAQYIGAIAAASVLGLLFGQRATDRGFHSVALVIGALSAVLLAVTIFDRTLPRGRV